jgi:hypothetical protein
MYGGAAMGQAAAAFSCQHQQCQQQQHPPLATLSHVLLTCPVAAAAWQWFLGVWQQVPAGGEQLPDVTNSRLMLLDDSSVWAPPATARQLWTYLRLQMLECLFQQASQSQQQPQQQPLQQQQQHQEEWQHQQVGQGQQLQQQQQQGHSREVLAVVCSFRAAVQQQVTRDFRRVSADVRLEAGVPLSWLPGKPPTLGQAEFWAKWGGLARGHPPTFAMGVEGV